MLVEQSVCGISLSICGLFESCHKLCGNCIVTMVYLIYIYLYTYIHIYIYYGIFDKGDAF